MRTQQECELVLKSIFPHENIIINSRKESSVKNSVTGEWLEVDVWFPNLRLCFEFQDEYHYRSTWYCNLPLDTVKNKDNAKRNELLEKGETLVTIPFWWNGSEASLRSTISFHRPDITANDSLSHDIVIPENPPHGFYDVVDTGNDLMLASFPLSLDLVEISTQSKWWMGEKYDGIRCWWSPHRRALFSRHGNELPLISPLSRVFPPNLVLDAELWSGRGWFAGAQLISLDSDLVHWPDIRMICFDEASNTVRDRDMPFEMRYERLVRAIRSNNPFVILAFRIEVARHSSVGLSLQLITSTGGEGVIVRRASSRYMSGRSDSLVKLKVAKGDQEGLVIEKQENGVLVLQSSDGPLFTCTRGQYQLYRAPVVGDIVSFTCDSRARGSEPSNPFIFRIRSDLLWDDVRSSAANDYQMSSMRKQSNVSVSSKPPHDAWYTKTTSLNVSKIDGSADNDLPKSLPLTLPLPLPHPHPPLESVPGITMAMMWQDIHNRREVFVHIADQLGFDPLVASNWYGVTQDSILNVKGAKSVIAHYYDHSLPKALLHLFPDIGFDKDKFKPKTLWTEASQRVAFFNQFATWKQFDPLVAENWYSVTYDDFKGFQGRQSIQHILQYHGGSLSDCLIQLYPNIGLNSNRLKKKPWQDKEGRRRQFIKAANELGFDPLVPANWYASRSQLFSTKGTRTIINDYYSNNIAKAIMDLFPEIGYVRRKAIQHKELFKKAARQIGFDPLVLDNWFSIKQKDLFKVKGISAIVCKYYGNNLATSLHEIFPDIGAQKRASM